MTTTKGPDMTQKTDKRAVLFCLDEPGGSPTADEFTGPGCGMKAVLLMEAVRGDFPDGALSVWMSPAARVEYGFQALGFTTDGDRTGVPQ